MKKFFAQNYKSILVVAIGIPVVAVVGWFRLDALNKSKHPAAYATAAASSPVSTSSTSSTLVLSPHVYKPGDCVNWNDDPGPQTERTTYVVSCDSPHLFEYVSKFDLQWKSTYPTNDEWRSIGDSNCTDPVNKYLGYALDTNGKFAVGVIHPSTFGWLQYDRTVQCGIELRGTADHPAVDDVKLDPFTGKVQGQDQSSLLTVGNCYANDATQLRAIACSAAHDYQISGNVKLSTKTRPSTDAQWNNAVGSQCESTGKHFAGGKIPVGLQTGWLSIEQTSWDAGERTVQCTLGKYDASGKLIQTNQSATAH